MVDDRATMTINSWGFYSAPRGELIDFVVGQIDQRSKSGLALAFVNPHSVISAAEDHDFRIALESFDLLLPDGIGIVLASRILGTPVAERIAGPDFFEAMTKRLNAQNRGRYFFLGSSDEVLSKITHFRRLLHSRLCGLGEGHLIESDRAIHVEDDAAGVLADGLGLVPRQGDVLVDDLHRRLGNGPLLLVFQGGENGAVNIVRNLGRGSADQFQQRSLKFTHFPRT